MNEPNATDSVTQPAAAARQVRTWPLWVSFLIQSVLFGLSVTPSINNAVRFGFMLIGPAVGLLLFLIWALFACRLRAKERLAIVGLVAFVVTVISLTIHESVGLAVFLYGVPLTTIAVLAAVVLAQNAESPQRLSTVAGLLVIAWAVFPMVRVDGYDGQYFPQLSFRWTPTSEQTLLKNLNNATTDISTEWDPTDAQWPGFRGPRRNGRVVSDAGTLNWSAAPPQEIWRKPIGPGWGSFIHVSGRLFTQEQRGNDEVVTCYDAATGRLIWMHKDAVRFNDVVSGTGPRATPEYANGRIYTYGSKAILNCLDAETGNEIWQHDLMKEVDAQLPVWGFSNSPLVIGDTVSVYADGDGDNGLVAFHVNSVEPVWQVASGGMNFSSAQRVTIDGIEQVIFGDGNGLRALNPTSGQQIWSFRPEDWNGPNVCQPQMVDDNDFVVPLGDGIGVTRLSAQFKDDAWQVSEVWSSNRLKPSFNDFVLHNGYLYGFDQSILVCLDAETGELRWKGGRYGFGQMLLLESQGQLIVVTETGDLILINATPEKLDEVARIPGVSGKTWNHPIVVQDKLFLRNGAEAVCFGL